MEPFYVIDPKGFALPLVVGSPHSGRNYPADFGYACSMDLLRQTEDAFVDELIAGASGNGATVICATFPRSYIDVNRAETDLDPAVLSEAWPERLQPSMRTLQGLGLVRRLCKSGVPMYERPLSAAAVKRRLGDYYMPYHAALTQIMERQVAQFGESWLIDCHSMPSFDGKNKSRQPDFVLGDRDGTSCDPAFTRKIRDGLQEMGYNVTLNTPYKGVEIMRRYGMPGACRHGIQLEINRDLYMRENDVIKHDGFGLLQSNLTTLFKSIGHDIEDGLPIRLAAE